VRSVFAGCAGFTLGTLFAVVLFAAAFFFLVSDASRTLSDPPAVVGKPDVLVTVSASYLNAQIRQTIAQSGIVKNPVINLAAPNVIKVASALEVSVAGQRISTNATITLRAAVQGGRVALTVEKIEAGGVNVPQSLIAPTIESVRKQAENQINAVVLSALKGTGLKLANLRMTANDLTIELTGQ